jgi:hypothetical protein
MKFILEINIPSARAFPVVRVSGPEKTCSIFDGGSFRPTSTAKQQENGQLRSTKRGISQHVRDGKSRGEK